MQNLFEGFQPVSLEKWKQQIEKDLKGITFEHLTKKDDSGLTVYPVYNIDNSDHRATSVFTNADWEIVSFVNEPDSKKANQTAIHDLNYGTQGLMFVVTNETNPEVLLKGISIEHISLHFVSVGNTVSFLDKFEKYAASQSIDVKKLSGVVIADPMNAVVRGEATAATEMWDGWKAIVNHKLVRNSNFTAYVTDAFPFHNAGANAVTELACTLAQLNEQLNFIAENKIDTAQKVFSLTACASINFFETVAKFRALRKLADFLLRQYGLKNEIRIHASHSLINKTSRDAWNNLIRSTIEGMAAVAGGANSLGLFSYDFAFGNSDLNGRRWALDQQLIFKEEALLSAVADAGAGSYFIDEYTHRLSEAAWQKFKDIEKAGGLQVIALNGTLKKMINEQADVLRKQIISGEKVLIGLNKFRNEKEKPAARTFNPSEGGKGLSFLIAETIIEHEQAKAISGTHA